MKLGDVCIKIGSGATPRGGKESYKMFGISLIRSQNVLDFTFSSDGIVFIDEQQAQQLSNVSVQSGDVLINITGDSVARACMAPDDYLPARVNQHVSIIRANPELAAPKFILYYLQQQKKNLLSLASGGGTRNALTKQMLETYDFPAISLPEQRAIADTLSALDVRIAENRAVNHHLASRSATDSSPDIKCGKSVSRRAASFWFSAALVVIVSKQLRRRSLKSAKTSSDGMKVEMVIMSVGLMFGCALPCPRLIISLNTSFCLSKHQRKGNLSRGFAPKKNFPTRWLTRSVLSW